MKTAPLRQNKENGGALDGMNILICEDNLVVAMDLEMTVEDLGHASVGIMRSALECRDRCRARRPDLVLVDLDLADGATGLELVDYLAASDIPSIIISGQSHSVGATRAVKVLSKPLKVKHFQDAHNQIPSV